MAARLPLPWMLATALLLGGCGDSDRDELEAYVAKVMARAPGPIEPLPDIKQIDTFAYEPGDRRDPFVADRQQDPVKIDQPANSLAPDPLRRKEELESYALDALRMVGTLEQDAVRWGLVRTQDGTLHRVRVGNYMGKNNGQVVGIGDDAIELVEIVSEGDEWRERQAKVTLR